MFRYEGEPVWDKRDEMFVLEVIDSSVGVKTIWEKHPWSKMTMRKDEFPHNGPSRYASETRDISGTQIKDTSYHVYDGEKSIGLKYVYQEGDPQFKDLEIGIGPFESDGSLLGVQPHYSARGHLRFFDLSIYPEENESDQVPPGLDQKLQHFLQRPLEANIKEVGQLYKHMGKKIFSPIPWDNEDEETYEENENDFLRAVTRRWAEGTSEKAHNAAAILSSVLVEQYLTELSKDEKDGIAFSIASEMLKGVAAEFVDFNYDSLSDQERRSVFTTALHDQMAQILAFYYQGLQIVGYNHIRFEIDEDDPEKIKVSVADDTPEKSPVFSTEISFGQECNFDICCFKPQKSGEDRVKLHVDSVTHPDFGGQFEFPAMVDVQAIHSLISIPQPTGWEKALGLVPVSAR